MFKSETAVLLISVVCVSVKMKVTSMCADTDTTTVPDSLPYVIIVYELSDPSGIYISEMITVM